MSDFWTNYNYYPTNSVSAPTADEIIQAAKKLQAIVPTPPTDVQRGFAKARGFPGYPGFIVAPDVLAALEKESPRPQVDVPLRYDRLYGIPVGVDASLPPGTIRSAEKEWHEFVEWANNWPGANPDFILRATL
jgi:hypothetical protein